MHRRRKRRAAPAGGTTPTLLAVGLRLTSVEVATEMLGAFLETDVDPTEADEIAKLR